MKNILAFGLLVAAIASAQVAVNQGRPGTQGAWPVTGVGGSSTSTGVDGGVVQTTPAKCAQTAADGGTLHKNTVVGATAANVPAAQTAARIWIEICNSLQNSGNPILKCRVDGVAPVAASTNPGDVLGIGDCAHYAIISSNVPQCISDTAGTNALSYECVEIGP